MRMRRSRFSKRVVCVYIFFFIARTPCGASACASACAAGRLLIRTHPIGHCIFIACVPKRSIHAHTRTYAFACIYIHPLSILIAHGAYNPTVQRLSPSSSSSSCNTTANKLCRHYRGHDWVHFLGKRLRPESYNNENEKKTVSLVS